MHVSIVSCTRRLRQIVWGLTHWYCLRILTGAFAQEFVLPHMAYDYHLSVFAPYAHQQMKYEWTCVCMYETIDTAKCLWILYLRSLFCFCWYSLARIGRPAVDAQRALKLGGWQDWRCLSSPALWSPANDLLPMFCIPIVSVLFICGDCFVDAVHVTMNHESFLPWNMPALWCISLDTDN